MMAPTRNMQLTLAALLRDLASVPTALDRVVLDITLDSREVGPGSCFIALSGTRKHGMHYIGDALARGATAILCDDEVVPAVSSVPVIAVRDLRNHLGLLAARCFDSPASALAVYAVTGTNGKTTVSHLLAQALTTLGAGCGYIGTLGAGRPGALSATANTTPDVISINRWLARFRDDGCTAATVEASSHALAQDRLADIPLAAAAFTNLGHDHLDYHGSLAHYAAAKRRLFACADLAAAVINVDDACGREIAAGLAAGLERWTVSSRGTARLRATAVATHADGSEFELVTAGASAHITSPLTGRFNVDNLLVIAALLLATDHRFVDVCATIPTLTAVPGRMQACGTTAAGARVVVDYAHSPDSLTAVLASLRELGPERLIVVFGCGGDRDRSKRPLMGHAAEHAADLVVITSDNPRTEDPAAIAGEIMAGMQTEPAAVIDDRRAAIVWAITTAAAGDIVLIAGKGHESTQERHGVFSAFDDATIVVEILSELSGERPGGRSA